MSSTSAPFSSTRALLPALLAAVLMLCAFGAQTSSAAGKLPAQDPFYSYSGSTPLAAIAPGTVLKTRTTNYHVVGFPLPVKAVQLLYRSAGASGEPKVNVTSVLLPILRLGTPNILSYQSAYDSLSPNDQPSVAIAGGVTFGGLVANAEALLITPMLMTGNAVVVPDTEGQTADLGAGPEYGYNTIYSLRAAMASSATGLSGAKKIVLVGYSGGALATEWASEMAPTYTPDVNKKIVGTTYGGVTPHPFHNLDYVSGSLAWAPVMAMVVIGIARAYNQDITPYLNDYGLKVFNDLKDKSIIHGFMGDLFKGYSGMTWQQLVKPQYTAPSDVPILVTIANKLIMGSTGTPTNPQLIYQGNQGWLNGTKNDRPGIGAGDGVMIAGDARTLAKTYCNRGLAVKYVELPLEHGTTGMAWLVESIGWVADRLAGRPAPQNCKSIPAGNSLDPIG